MKADWMIEVCAAGLALVALAGCSAEEASTIDSNRANGASGAAGTAASAGGSSSGGSGSGGSAGGSSNGGSGGTPVSAGGSSSVGGGGGTSTQTPLELPFYVNAPGNFVKSGFMGDAADTVLAAPSEADPDGTCGGERAPDAGGECDSFTITPVDGGQSWQGVFYQFPANNWGSFPGRSIAPGATSVKFSVRATRPVAVTFQVGMCDPEDPELCADGFHAYPDGADEAGKITVGTSYEEVSVSLSDVDYSGGVRGAFSWALANEDLLGELGELALYVDNLRWE